MSLPNEKLKVTAWLWFLAGLWSQSQETGVLSLALQLQYDTSQVTSTFYASLA